ncbi:hypothetical protein [Parasphingorhabdus sp.]|jgi:hypothetical protein|uniref:hypothetical protein n=1 Tax=Parasphingorhabdus sp. TaxID=2709688 RepID=UPI003D2D47D3
MRATAQAIEPNTDIKVKLIDVDESSAIFNTIIDWFEQSIEPKLEQIQRGDGRIPRVRSLLLTIAPFLVITAYPTYLVYFSDDDGYTDEDRKKLDEIHQKCMNDPAVQTARRKFFRTVERESTITEVSIKESPDGPSVYTVKREHFAEAAGFFDGPEEDERIQITRPVLEVILVRPTLKAKPRSWTFKPEGLPEFEAVMKDPEVLSAIGSSGLPEKLREGIPMTVRLEVKEVFEEGGWKLVRGGRSVTKVISPKLD